MGCSCLVGKGGNTRPAATMSARPSSSRCAHCGAGLAVPRPGPGGAAAVTTVRCALCHRMTRVDRRGGRDLGGGGGGGALEAASSSWAPAEASFLRRDAPSGYPFVPGRKRALLVGVSYKGTSYELEGTVNDVDCMRRLLGESFGFPADSILVLTEELGDGDPSRSPTRANLLAAMRWLVEGCDAGDSLVFHFSGHGVQKLDVNGDEVDGYNEALCPVDFERSGKILDDEINETIVRPLVAGAKLHAIVDTCHSGTILDLPFLCRLSRTGYWQWENHCRRPELAKGTSGGLAISISGCSDDQKSADSSGFSSEQAAAAAAIGAMTYSFIRAVESEPGTTYGRLLAAMRATIREGQQGSGVRRLLPGRLGSFVRKMIPSGGVQEPQLCASEVFDIYRKPFLL
ncbi:metacaspase-1-like [Oryza glaberrima]|uniref:metacaspase-1-like n=1 Tax=Oryza glaberrima TaxID=4538 RepID=UPI00224BF431|nr:metacaspase-1-like [Oryza glaberrima]